MNLNSFENHLFEEGGVKYTRNEEYAEEIGYIKVNYSCIYFNGAKWEDNIMQSWVYVRSEKDAIYLLNYWNSKNSNYKYWV